MVPAVRLRLYAVDAVAPSALALSLIVGLVSAGGCGKHPDGADPARGTPPVVSPSVSSPAPSTTTTAASARADGAPSASIGAPAPEAAPALALEIVVPATVLAAPTPEKRPLVVLLHGLGNTGRSSLAALHFSEIASEKKFVYAAPEGTKNSQKAQFWNASKACCDFDGTHPDHVRMLREALEKAKQHPYVDPERIYLVGFSNGGFFAHRAACEIEGIAAIASIAGAGPAEGERCTPKVPLRVLQVHGDADKAVRYTGGRVLDKPTVFPHPSARATIDGWAARNGCTGAPTAAGTIDFEDKIEGAETTVLRFAGCKAKTELWTVKGGTHYLGTSARGIDAVWAFLDGDRKRAAPAAPKP
jgi:polyhydroxybutyrate depolymerase